MKRLALIAACLLVPLTGLAQTDTPTETPTETPTVTPTVTPTITPTMTPTTISCAGVARFWVGNSGNWGDQAHWACVSGGPGGASVPDCVAPHGPGNYQSTNSVFFDANSFSLAGQVVAPDIVVMCANIYDAINATNNPTLALPTYVSDSFLIPVAVVLTPPLGGELNFSATSGTHFVQSSGHCLPAQVDFFGTATLGDAATWDLLDDFCTTSPTLFSYGTLNTNDHTLRAGGFSHANNTPNTFTLNAGASTFVVSGVLVSWDMHDTGGGPIIFNAGTSVIDFPSFGITEKFQGGGYTYATVRAVIQDGSIFRIEQNNTIDTLIVSSDLVDGNANPQVLFESLTVQQVNHWNVSGSASLALDIGSLGSDPWLLLCSGGTCQGDYDNVTNGVCFGTTPCLAGVHGSVDALSAANGWSATSLATPTPTPTVVIPPTINITQQYPRERVEHPYLLNGTPVPDTAAYGVDFGAGISCTSVPEPVQGRTKLRLRCTVP